MIDVSTKAISTFLTKINNFDVHAMFALMWELLIGVNTLTRGPNTIHVTICISLALLLIRRCQRHQFIAQEANMCTFHQNQESHVCKMYSKNPLYTKFLL